MMNRKLFSLLVAFLIGGIFGGALMGFLSMRASKVYSEIVKTNYEQEQETIGDQLWKRGKLSEAVIHYSNVVQVLSGTEMKSLSPDHVWSFGFPFAAIILNEITNKADVSGRGKAFAEGIARGKLGMVLESLGRKEEAQREYRAAAKLTGMNDIDRVKKFISDLNGKELSLPHPLEQKKREQADLQRG
jgi:hypothetical protein